jgi:hypothetical protein
LRNGPLPQATILMRTKILLPALVLVALAAAHSACLDFDAAYQQCLDGGCAGADGGADAGESDAGESDAGESDAGESDAGESDAGEPDAGADAGQPDAGADGGFDAGEPDAGFDGGADGGPGCSYTCPSQQWCLVHQQPQGRTIYRIRGATPDDVWAVGDHGTVVRMSPCGVTESPRAALRELLGLWVSEDGGTVWAGGSYLDGTSLRHAFSRWTAASNTWSDSLTTLQGATVSVWGSSPQDVWFAGFGGFFNGVVFRSTGAVPALVTNEPVGQSARAVYGATPNDIWFVGRFGETNRFDGASWYELDTLEGTDLWGVWGSSGDKVWITGDNGYLARFNQNHWVAENTAVSGTLRDIHGRGDQPWVASTSGEILVGTDAGWATESTGSISAAMSIFVDSSGAVWVGTAGGEIFRRAP